MTVAAIDVGSNTIKVLVASRKDKDIEPLLEKSLPVRLGEGTFETGLLPEAGIKRGVEAVAKLLQVSKEANAEKIGIFATSAVRSAKNGADFQAAVLAHTGQHVTTLSGDHEAEMIFRGVSSSPEFHGEKIWVVDVGGGSVEFVLGRDGLIERKLSLEVGAVRLRAKYLTELPPAPELIKKTTDILLNEFQAHLSDWPLQDVTLVATGGTVLCLDRWRGGEHDNRINLDELQELSDEIAPLTPAELQSDSRIPPGRGEVLLAGTLTYLSALRFSGKDTFQVSRRNLRYGLADALLAGQDF